MTDSFGQELYYRHSGRFSTAGVLIALLVGLAVGLPCAWLYAWLIHWNPFLYFNVVASILFGAVIGASVETALEKYQCRNSWVAGLAACVVVLIAYYVSWAVWL